MISSGKIVRAVAAILTDSFKDVAVPAVVALDAKLESKSFNWITRLFQKE